MFLPGSETSPLACAIDPEDSFTLRIFLESGRALENRVLRPRFWAKGRHGMTRHPERPCPSTSSKHGRAISSGHSAIHPASNGLPRLSVPDHWMPALCRSVQSPRPMIGGNFHQAPPRRVKPPCFRKKFWGKSNSSGPKPLAQGLFYNNRNSSFGAISAVGHGAWSKASGPGLKIFSPRILRSHAGLREGLKLLRGN